MTKDLGLVQTERREPLTYRSILKPQRLGKRKRVTIIASFQCTDGLLMCADSEQATTSESKSQMRKIQKFNLPPHGYVAVGGAGDDGNIIDYIQYELFKKLGSNCPQWEEADSWLQGFATDMWNTCIRPYRGFAYQLVPSISFLIGLQMHGSYRLYKWERNFVYEIPRNQHASIGIGIAQSESLLNDLQFTFPAKQMLFYAVRMMLRVKQLVQGCGGKTEVIFLGNDGIVVIPATTNIDAIEYLAEEADNFLIEKVLQFVCSPAKPDEDAELKQQLDDLRRFKAQYERLVPKFLLEFGTF